MPKLDPRLLPESAAQVAENVDLERGHIRPLNAPLPSGTLGVSGAGTIYPYRGSWLAWSGLVNVVKAPLESDPYDRIYWTGDGAPKVRGLAGTTPTTYPLGVPKPTGVLSAAIRNKSSIKWTRKWGYFYEEPDGTQKDLGALAEGAGGVQVIYNGRNYRINSIPPRVTASSNATFVMFFDAYKPGDILMGRVYPGISKYVGNSDLYVNGAKVDATQTTSGTIVNFALGYNTTTETRSFTVKVKKKTKTVSAAVPVEQWNLVRLYYTQDKAWVYTFVTAWGEEGPPSDPSTVTSMDPATEAVLTGFNTTVPAGYNITKLRIYRTVTGDAGTEFAYVGEMSLGTATFTDDIDDEDTDEVLPSTIWYAPPDDLAGLVAMPGEFLAGFTGKTVYFSEPGYPHAWPAGYSLTVEDDIVGLGVSGSNLVVTTKGMPLIITVPEPTQASVFKVPSPQSCVSAAGIVENGGAVFFPSPDGYVMMSGATAIVSTANYFTKEQWQSYDPASMTAAVYDGRIYLFSSNTTLILTYLPEGVTITTSTERATAAYYYDDEDTLYIAQGTTLAKWDQGTTKLTARWRSREYTMTRPIDPAVGRITADGYPLTFTAIDGDLASVNRTVRTDTAFRMPRVHPEKFWSFEVQGQQVIRELLTSGSMSDL